MRISVLPSSTRALVRLLLIVAALVLILSPVFSQAASANASGARIPLSSEGIPRKAYFPETRHHVAGDFLNHWLNNGRFTIYGFPISEPVVEDGRIVQYFERARLELWPENADSEWVVQGTLLGHWKADELSGSDPFDRVDRDELESEGDYYFQETGHTLSGDFKRYWDNNGGVHVFGFPISEEFEEGGFRVQYFERARFEWHPENAGTEYEVLLGHLGKEYAEENDVDLEGVGRASDAAGYDAGIFTPEWNDALENGSNARWARVSVDALNIRPDPSIESGSIGLVYHAHPLQIERMVRGAEEEGSDAWFELSDGGFVPAVYVDPLVVPTPPETYSGHWVDVNLTDFYAVAYNGDTPVYVATITAGRDDRTPKGVFQVNYRVENETMDSSTVGFPEGHPEYYYLEDVKYTQYFLAGGFALHSNYWTDPWNFGSFSSNGCVGLFESDAEFFWNWLDVGSTVSIHF